jgi:hypothetical protein
MTRIEKVGEMLVRAFTYPIRATIGVCKCIHKSTPDTLNMPFEIKLKKEDKNADNA